MEETITKYMSRLKPNERLRNKEYVKITEEAKRILFRTDIQDIAEVYFKVLGVNKDEARQISNYVRIGLDAKLNGRSFENHKASYAFPAYGLIKNISNVDYGFNTLRDLSKKYKLSKNELIYIKSRVTFSIEWDLTVAMLKSYTTDA